MNRQLGIGAIVGGAALLVMGVLVLLVPTPSGGLGIGFLVVGVPLTVVGIWLATQRSASAEHTEAPTRTRPKSKFHQILDGLSFFS